MTKIKTSPQGMPEEAAGDEPVALLDQARAAADLRAERYKHYRQSLIDPDDKQAAREVARLDRELADLDLRTLAINLRQELVSLRAEYERLDVMISMPPAEPREVDVLTEQCKLNEQRHGVYASHRDLPDWQSGRRTLDGVEGVNVRRIRPQEQAPRNDFDLTDEERAHE